MKTIYIGQEFRTHTEPGDGRSPIETEAFDGACDTLINGYRYIPDGESWTDDNGKTYQGEMLSPAVPIEYLIPAQKEYERTQAAMEKAYREGVNSI